MGEIIDAVQRGAKAAHHKAPRGVFVACPTDRVSVSVIKQGVVVGLRNWVVNTRTGEATCKAYRTGRLGHEESRESNLRGGSIEEIIWSVVMAVAMGAYDDVPE